MDTIPQYCFFEKLNISYIVHKVRTLLNNLFSTLYGLLRRKQNDKNVYFIK